MVFFGTVLIGTGVLFILLAIMFFLRAQGTENPTGKIQSRGVILLGPIPIVWGFGDRGKVLAAVLFVAILSIWILLAFL